MPWRVVVLTDEYIASVVIALSVCEPGDAMNRVLLALPLVVAMLALSAVAVLGMLLTSIGSASAQQLPGLGEIAGQTDRVEQGCIGQIINVCI